MTMTNEAPPTRVELLERRWLRILAVHGRLVDREPEVNEDGEAVVVPIPRGIEDETWDTLDVSTDAPMGHGSIRARALAGLPCLACGANEWYRGARTSMRGEVVYCKPCKRESVRKARGR